MRLRKYKISYYIYGVKHCRFIEATNEKEALNKAWSLIDAEDIYISEVTE